MEENGNGHGKEQAVNDQGHNRENSKGLNADSHGAGNRRAGRKRRYREGTAFFNREHKVRNSVFLALLLGFFGIVFVFFFGATFLFENAVWIAILIVFLFLVWKYDYVLQLTEYERAVVFTLGRVSGVVGPGWVAVFPPIQSYTKVDTRTKVIDIKPQSVVTSDGVEVMIDALLYIKVGKDKDSVLKSVLEVEDYETAAKSYVHALLRDVIGSITLTDLISSIEQMSVRLKSNLEKIAARWGVTVESVKIQEVKIPPTVLQAMHDEKAATQQKLAAFQKAEAHEREILAVKQAAENLSDKALAYYYVKALEEIGKSGSTKLVLPLEVTRLLESFTQKKISSDELESAFKKFEPQIRAIVSGKKPKKKK